ncbi:MAG: thermonuclease family protein [Bullifex sp.]|nr:thermonuclease family protein [Bullifex sp.]
MRIPELTKRFTLTLLVLLILSSCATVQEEASADEHTDYASALSFSMGSETVKCAVTVRTFIDGDTTHFSVPSEVIPDGVLKARFLAVNTPESTGKIEEWGKRAALYTKEKLSGAESIWIESDTSSWNLDSTGDRHLVWVWYRTGTDEEYRCLNLELLQEGLALPSSSANNRYGSYCMAAIDQAKREKLCVWSGEKDPDFFYGDAVELTLAELRAHIADYNGVKVAFEGNITINSGNTVYSEDVDPETGCVFAIPVYYGFSMNGSGLDILSVGNRVRIVGTVQYYEGGESWQVSGLKYRQMRPDDPSNIKLVRKGVDPVWRDVSLEELLTEEVSVGDDGVTLPLSQAVLASTVTVRDLLVNDTYVSGDVLTLVCTSGDFETEIRVEARGVSEADLKGRTVSVKGIADSWKGKLQIKVFRAEDLSVND